MIQKELSVVIVNYNGIKFLQDCIISLTNNLRNIDFEIVIVDNDSLDDSVLFLKNNFPEIVLIESKKNLGFGLGNNLGVKHACGKNILLFNNDTILLDRLDEALDLLNSNSDIGVIGAKMLNKNKEYLPAAGIFPSIFNMIFFSKLYINTPEFVFGNFTSNYYEVDWLAGSFLLLKKKTYNKISGFDPDYFMYVEDVDFSKKIANLGLKRVFMPNVSYIHYVGFSKSKNIFLIKGYKIYIKKHYKGFKKLAVSIILQLKSLIK